MKAGMIGAAALAIAACMGSADAAGLGSAAAGLAVASDNVQTVQATDGQPAPRRRMRRAHHRGGTHAMRGSRAPAQGSDAAYMGGGMVMDGSAGTGGGMGAGPSSMPGTMGGTTGQGTSGMQQSPMPGSGMPPGNASDMAPGAPSRGMGRGRN